LPLTADYSSCKIMALLILPTFIINKAWCLFKVDTSRKVLSFSLSCLWRLLSPGMWRRVVFLMMTAAGSPATSAHIYHTTRRNVPEVSNRHCLQWCSKHRHCDTFFRRVFSHSCVPATKGQGRIFLSPGINCMRAQVSESSFRDFRPLLHAVRAFISIFGYLFSAPRCQHSNGRIFIQAAVFLGSSWIVFLSTA